jgi:Uma2 family endonuclease
MTRTAKRPRAVEYPTSDGKPMAETERHRRLLYRVIELLETWFAADPNVYVSGNMLLFYEEGNRRRHVAPDCFVVFGVEKYERENYLLWAEGKGPDVVIELTSRTTRGEDTKKKFDLYRNVLKVKEYFLFDPLWHYLDPPLKGYRLVRGKYAPIPFEGGRLPSELLRLHLVPDGDTLHFWDPKTGRRLETAAEENIRLREEITRFKLAQRNGGHKNGH